MFRYNFVPLAEMPDGRIAIAVADPSQLLLLDEITLLLGKRIVARVATLAQINTILNRVDEAIRRYRTRRPTNLLAPAIQTRLSGLLLSPDRTYDQVLQKLFPSKSSRIAVETSIEMESTFFVDQP